LKRRRISQHTVREELPEHERMVRFAMVARKSYVFVHIEGHNILETVRRLPTITTSIQSNTYDSFFSFTKAIRALYVGIGDEPVGSPKTKGRVGVGANSLILQEFGRSKSRHKVQLRLNQPLANIVCDVIANGLRILTND
jgi:hypothetical protein